MRHSSKKLLLIKKYLSLLVKTAFFKSLKVYIYYV